MVLLSPRWSHQIWLGCVVGMLALATGSRAVADAEPVVLTWRRGTGAEGCITPQALRQRVARQLGRELASEADRAQLTVHGSIQYVARARGYRATIRVVHEQAEARGKREVIVAGRDCRKIDDALVLVVTLVVESGGESGDESRAQRHESDDADRRRTEESVREPTATSIATIAAPAEAQHGARGSARCKLVPDSPRPDPALLSLFADNSTRAESAALDHQDVCRAVVVDVGDDGIRAVCASAAGQVR